MGRSSTLSGTSSSSCARPRTGSQFRSDVVVARVHTQLAATGIRGVRGCTTKMVKLITPIGMLITVALLAIYAAYAFWTAYVHIEYLPDYADEAWIYGSLGALSLVACYGTAMLRPWSQYLVYVLTALFIAGWCYSVYSGAAVG